MWIHSTQDQFLSIVSFEAHSDFIPSIFVLSPLLITHKTIYTLSVSLPPHPMPPHPPPIYLILCHWPFALQCLQEQQDSDCIRLTQAQQASVLTKSKRLIVAVTWLSTENSTKEALVILETLCVQYKNSLASKWIFFLQNLENAHNNRARGDSRRWYFKESTEELTSLIKNKHIFLGTSVKRHRKRCGWIKRDFLSVSLLRDVADKCDAMPVERGTSALWRELNL